MSMVLSRLLLSPRATVRSVVVQEVTLLETTLRSQNTPQVFSITTKSLRGAERRGNPEKTIEPYFSLLYMHFPRLPRRSAPRNDFISLNQLCDNLQHPLIFLGICQFAMTYLFEVYLY